MSVASEELISAKGWQEFDVVDNTDKSNQQHLDFAHDVAKIFKTREGKRVLKAMVQKYLLGNIVSPNDTNMGVGIKQGRADVIKNIMAQIEISDEVK